MCASAVELYCDECQIARPVVDLFIGTPFGNRLRALSFDMSQVAADDLLACARGFPQLRALVLPQNELGGVAFYEALARARPSSLISNSPGPRPSKPAISQQHARC